MCTLYILQLLVNDTTSPPTQAKTGIEWATSRTADPHCHSVTRNMANRDSTSTIDAIEIAIIILVVPYLGRMLHKWFTEPVAATIAFLVIFTIVGVWRV